jgi:hypothetical protein
MGGRGIAQAPPPPKITLAGSELTAKYLYTLDFTDTYGAIAALVGATKTRNIDGLLTTDAVSLQAMDTLSGACISHCWVSSAGVLSIRFVTAVALGVTLGAIPFRLTVVR